MIRPRKRSDGTTGYQVTYPGAKSRTFDSRKDARLYESHAKSRHRLGEFAPVEPETLSDALTRRLSRCETELKAKSMANLREAEKNLGPLAHLTFPMLRRLDAENVIRQVAARPAPRQAQIALALLKAVCKEAVENGQRVDPGIAGLKPPRYKSRQPMFLTKEQVYELSSWLPEYVRRVVIVAALTGLRQGELFALKAADIDEEVLHVREGKTAASRRQVPLSGAARNLLREQLVARPPSVYVFPFHNGSPFLPNTFMYRHFRPATYAAGLEGLTFHDLRHTFASFLIRASVGEHGQAVTAKLGADALGHADGGVLFLRTYGHLFKDAGQVVVKALDALWEAEA